MNAAARIISQSTLFNGQLFAIRLSKRLWLILILMALVLLSSLAVVYSTNEYRINFSKLQKLKLQAHYLQLQWGKLLLEQASLATPARVEDLAKQKLHMSLPEDKQTFVLQAR